MHQSVADGHTKLLLPQYLSNEYTMLEYVNQWYTEPINPSVTCLNN